MVKKTLTELAGSEREFFTANDISGVVGCDPNTIRVMAHDRPDLLGFPVIVMGHRVKIPKIPFLRFMGLPV